MPFDQSTTFDVRSAPRGADLAVYWSSSAPAGTCFQVYVGRRLAWHGQARSTVLPHPSSPCRIEVGAVLASEATRNFSASLPTPPGGGSRARLSWLGGRFLSPTILGFHVYAGTVAGGAVSYAAPVDRVAAYPQGVVNDGWNVGPYSQGGYGFAAGTYTWTSDPLLSGVWNFAVRSFDAAENEGASITWSVTIAGPPQPVARNTSGKRLAYQFKRGAAIGYGTGGWNQGGYGTGYGYGDGGYNLGGYGFGGGEGLPYVTLNWLASPG